MSLRKEKRVWSKILRPDVTKCFRRCGRDCLLKIKMNEDGYFLFKIGRCSLPCSKFIHREEFHDQLSD